MVMCDVGIKCPDCIKKTKSHVENVALRHYLIAGVLSAIAGFFFGWIYRILEYLPFGIFGISFLGLIATYALGRSLGEFISRVSGRKIATSLALCVMFFAAAGLLVSPFIGVLLTFLELLHSAQNIQGNFGGSSAFLGFATIRDVGFAYLFINGLRSPFSWKQFFWN